MHFRNMKMASLSVAALLPIVGYIGAQTSQPAQRPQWQTSDDDRFKRWDRNGDGKLTQEEAPGERLFRMFDRDSDGVVTKDEAGAIVERGAGQRQRWRGVGVSESAPLPPAEGFQPRAHGDEARAAGLKPEVLAKIDVEMQRHVAAPDVAGIVALICRNGHVGYFETFGLQDREANKPMPKDAICRLQSMTKPLIAACALTLYDEGKFSLDEPISKHLPEWQEPKVQEKDGLVPARHAITPRMLMSHSSGLYYGDIEKGAFAGGGLRREANTTLESYSQELAQKPLKFHPGEGYSYGTSIDVLGRYLEAVSGKPLDELLKERVLGPLKMADTDFWVPKEKAGRVAQLYTQPEPGKLVRGRPVDRITTKPNLFLGGQGLCSTAADYERFCRMILNGGEIEGTRILKPETVDLMFQNHLKTPGQKYGLGGVVDGEGHYAWGGANGTQFWIDRKNGLFAVFMVQTQHYRSPAFNAFKKMAGEAVEKGAGAAPVAAAPEKHTTTWAEQGGIHPKEEAP